MTTYQLNVNGRRHSVDADPDTPLLYVLRNDLGLNGAKFGCGLGQCGACTVLVGGEAYFLHSYHFKLRHHEDVLAMTDHGGGLVAAIGRDNFLGVQFHPEKSQAYGLDLLSRFLEWKP